MYKQTGKSKMKRFFSEATLQRIAEIQTSTSMVVPAYISTVVLKRCRMAVWKYRSKPVRNRGNKASGNQQYKSTMKQ
jgi:hypothetical protein